MSTEVVTSKGEETIMSGADENLTSCAQKPDANDGLIRMGTMQDLLNIRLLPEIVNLFPVNHPSYHILEEMTLSANAAHTLIITADIDGMETFVDGIREINIIQKYPERKIKFYIKKLLHLHTVDDIILWSIRHSQSYIRLNRVQRAKLALKIEPFYKKLAAENKKRCGRKKKENLSESDKLFEPVDCLGLMARDAQVSKQFITDVKYILNSTKRTAEDERYLEEQKYGASTIRNRIKKRIKPRGEGQEDKNNEPPVEVQNLPKGKYEDEIVNGDNCEVLDQMRADGLNNVAATIISPNYNVNLKGYGPYFSDNLPHDKYLERLGEAFYKAQLIGREGMRLCVVIPDTVNRFRTDDSGDYVHNIVKDLGNVVDAINDKYDDCNLRFWGRIHCYKQHSNAKSCLGSIKTPVLKCDSDEIMVFVKDQRRLPWLNDADCSPHWEDTTEPEISPYRITMKDYMAWTYQTWMIPPCGKDTGHPCAFNSEIPRRLILLFTEPEDTVLDCYCGIGTTLKMAKDLHRHYIGIDIDPNFCEIARRNVNPEHAEDSKTDERQV